MATTPTMVIVPDGCQYREDMPFEEQPVVWGSPSGTLGSIPKEPEPAPETPTE